MTAAWPSAQIALDRADQRRRLHRREQMAEEALLGALEGGARGGLGLRVQRAGLAGDVGGPHRGVEIVVDDREGAGIGVVDADLLGRELMLDQLILDAFVGQRARRIEAERLEVARQHLHGRDAAVLDRLDELGARGEREVLATPQAEPLGIGEVVDRGGAGRRDVDDAGVRQACWSRSPARPCCEAAWSPRSPLPPAAFCIAWLSSKMITPSKSEPNHSTICWTRESFSPRVVGSQRGIGREKDAFPSRIGVPWRKRDSGVTSSRSMPSADQSRCASSISLSDLLDPDRAAAALEPVVEQDAGDLAALAGAGAVAQKPAAAEADGVLGIVARGGDDVKSLVDCP